MKKLLLAIALSASCVPAMATEQPTQDQTSSSTILTVNDSVASICSVKVTETGGFGYNGKEANQLSSIQIESNMPATYAIGIEDNWSKYDPFGDLPPTYGTDYKWNVGGSEISESNLANIDVPVAQEGSKLATVKLYPTITKLKTELFSGDLELATTVTARCNDTRPSV